MPTPDDPQDPDVSLPPEAWKPLRRIAHAAAGPIERFLGVEASSGVVLLIATVSALVWANSPWAESYSAFWQAPIGLRAATWEFERPLEWFVNDGLMVIFFFVVGLEIRREIHQGELSEWSRASLPAAAALGGALVPALLYLAFAGSPSTRSGWGIPMATDIAFAVGILTLLGRRVPSSLRVLLLAVAVVDDLIAILVIAFFYSKGIALSGLAVAALGVGGIFAMQGFGVRVKALYIVPSVVAWAGTYAAGFHPTIAGVVIGLVTPVRAWFGPKGFLTKAEADLARLGRVQRSTLPSKLSEILAEIGKARREAVSPSERLDEVLHPWVAFGIMPLFALANAGISFSSEPLHAAARDVALGVGISLVVGKPLGVLVVSWATLRLRIGSLPTGITLKHMFVLGTVAGVGFTMSLFIAGLALADPRLLAAAKLSVLAASAVAASLGLVIGRAVLASGSAARRVDGPADPPEGRSSLE